jgi:hypothetical protein
MSIPFSTGCFIMVSFWRRSLQAPFLPFQMTRVKLGSLVCHGLVAIEPGLLHLRASHHIKTRIPGRWDYPRGPLLLGGLLALVLMINFFSKLYHIATQEEEL